ncbi:tyrosine-type recombinase/integrase [Bifidobacterium biavatii]|uniref:Site-specific recombinase XerD n=1 Tax=Bifidobacterium biavatii DSM 23969 TaxID=1437608 RepID=A0A086ZN10_9BIFI|nr:site-specific integrase [Bifidobacterium biavatii]KFI47910.1 site-specific recombinase XerD [Bifidobacterium biavatii DSM 23969]
MPNVWIDDLWLKTDHGTPPTPEAKRALANAHDPFKAKVDERWRTTRYGNGKRWRCRWYVTSDGERRQRSKSFAKWADAEAFRTSLEDDIRQDKYVDPRASLRLFRNVAEQWLRSKNNLTDGVRAKYECELRFYVNPKWGDVSLRSIDEDAVAQWIADLAAGSYPTGGPAGRAVKPLSPRSIKSIVKVVFAGVFDYAIAQRYLLRNPARDASVPRPQHQDLVYLDIGQIEQLAAAAERVGRPVDALIVRFQSYVGTRINETFALQVNDLDLQTGHARIRRTWKNSAKRQQIGPPKSGRPRTVAIPKFLIPALAELVEGQSGTAFVFRGARGAHINDHNWRRRIWRPAVKQADLQDMPHLTPHTLRHSYAAIAIRAGADIKALQQQMGHASASLTLDVYGFMFDNRLQEVANAVDSERASALQSSANSSTIMCVDDSTANLDEQV